MFQRVALKVPQVNQLTHSQSAAQLEPRDPRLEPVSRNKRQNEWDPLMAC